MSETNSTYVDINENPSEWLKALKQNGLTQRSEEVKQDVISLSAFYSTNLQKQPIKDILTMLPLIKESINSPAVVYHCLYLISKLTLKLNPNQIPIVTVDQPVYAIAKQVQWNYPEKFESCFLMLGPLHIEMAFLNAIGDWLEGSGWTDVFEKQTLTQSGALKVSLVDRKLREAGMHIKFLWQLL